MRRGDGECLVDEVVKARGGRRVPRGGELIECGSVDEAVEIAASHPLSQIGAIEVRPLWGNS